MTRAPHRDRSTWRQARWRGAIAALAGFVAAVGVVIFVPAAPVLAAPCSDPQNAPADPALWGGFGIDGNLCRNITGTTGALDWDTVGGQPVATDLIGTPDIS